jgi:aspartyl-tRNA(Asn)/glutamyl-tRNA(Gln) amidotransferase subunit B
LPLEVSADELGAIAARMPELPAAMRGRFVSSYGLSQYDAALLTATRDLADYFEQAAAQSAEGLPKLVANWMTGALAARLNEAGIEIQQSKVTPRALRNLVERIADTTISSKTAREVFDALWRGEGSVDEIIESRGLRQISDSGALEAVVAQIVAANAQQVADYQSGKAKAFNSLVGQVMKATKGQANPQQVAAILRRQLAVATSPGGS